MVIYLVASEKKTSSFLSTKDDNFKLSANSSSAYTAPVTTISDWHRADIIAALHKSGTTVVALSRASGLSNSSLSNVFYRSWPRGERIIANWLGVPPQSIWPSRYKGII